MASRSALTAKPRPPSCPCAIGVIRRNGSRSRCWPCCGEVVPVDALWWATSDPATLLFTQAFREGIPDRTIPYLVDNEFPAVTSTSGPNSPRITAVSGRWSGPPAEAWRPAPGSGTCSSRWGSATNSARCCGPATTAGA